LLLSVDFEDWHQLMHRRVGVPDWDQPGPALERQTNATLDLLDELRARATFFVLGMTARWRPALVAQIAQRGHEIACHGYAHRPVHTQAPREFAADLRAARELLTDITGTAPVGYRAPAFSITRDVTWAYEVLAAEGFAYDSSQHDSPRIRHRVSPASAEPHLMALSEGHSLWEFPIAVWHLGRLALPVGGGTYWGVMPAGLICRGLYACGPHAGLYLHPHELDDQPLAAALPASVGRGQRLRAAVRVRQREAVRRRAPAILRAVAERFRLISYGEVHAELSERLPASTPALSHGGAVL
jgi:polysaccharide deacetylase family protein (PEP-CTERM system associated)